MLLAAVYAQTLDMLRKHRGEITGADLARKAGCSNEAMCNRLKRLEELDFVESRVSGRCKFYSERD